MITYIYCIHICFVTLYNSRLHYFMPTIRSIIFLNLLYFIIVIPTFCKKKVIVNNFSLLHFNLKISWNFINNILFLSASLFLYRLCFVSTCSSKLCFWISHEVAMPFLEVSYIIVIKTFTIIN